MPFPPTPTAITCPFCRAQVTVPVRQIVDVSEEPLLKEAVLAGRLNVFRCPSCGNVGALATPFFYHDPDKELAFVFMPMQVGLQNADQQRLIGSLSNAVTSRLPPEKRKAYLLQPKQFFTQQSLAEAILAADGITPEMLAAQQAKVELLQQMLDMAEEQRPAFIQENDARLDDELFEIFTSLVASAQAGGAQDITPLVKLRDQLMEHSTVGRKIKKQQQALEAFAASPSREALLEQLILAPDAETREMLVTFGRSLLDYPFFQALTAKIEAATAAGDKDQAARLTNLRKEVQEVREKLDAATQALFEKRAALVREMITSGEPDKVARLHLTELDDVFFSVLETNLEAAQQGGQQQVFERLQRAGEAAMRAIQSTQPPEVRFINTLLALDYPDQTRQLLEANKHILSPQFINWMRRLAGDLRRREQTEAADKLDQIIQQAAQMAGPAVAVARA